MSVVGFVVATGYSGEAGLCDLLGDETWKKEIRAETKTCSLKAMASSDILLVQDFWDLSLLR